MSISHLLNRTFNRWRKTEVSDGGGGVTVVWALQDTIDGRLSAPSPSEREAAAQEGIQISYVLYLPADSDVARGDRLVDGDITVEVLSVTVPSIPTHHKKATAKQEPWDEPTT